MSHPPTEILPFLYLGGVGDSLDKKLLNDLQITHVLNVRETPPHPLDKFSGQFLHVPISDYGESDILSLLDKCFEFIDSAYNSGGRILIHCGFGQNRLEPLLTEG